MAQLTVLSCRLSRTLQALWYFPSFFPQFFFQLKFVNFLLLGILQAYISVPCHQAWEKSSHSTLQIQRKHCPSPPVSAGAKAAFHPSNSLQYVLITGKEMKASGSFYRSWKIDSKRSHRRQSERSQRTPTMQQKKKKENIQLTELLHPLKKVMFFQVQTNWSKSSTKLVTLGMKFTSTTRSLSQKSSIASSRIWYVLWIQKYEHITGQPTEILVCCAEFHEINFLAI